ncbi:hypothetical protein ACFQU7_23950 [Pseudoroseomonas wenyumeiae]
MEAGHQGRQHHGRLAHDGEGIHRPGVVNGAIGSVPYLRKRILAEYPAAKFNDDIRHRMTEDEVIAFLSDCDSAIMGGDVVNDRVLEALPHIRDIGIFGVGLNTVDLPACQRHGVRLGFTLVSIAWRWPSSRCAS